MTGVRKTASTYNALLGEIKERIRSSQYEALKAVNKGLCAVQNLRYMRQLFLEYSGKPKLQPLVVEISWTNRLGNLTKCFVREGSN